MKAIEAQLKSECRQAEQAFEDQQWNMRYAGIDYWGAHGDHIDALNALNKFERIMAHAKRFEDDDS